MRINLRTLLSCLFLLVGPSPSAIAQGLVEDAAPVRVTLADILLPDADQLQHRDFLQLVWNGRTNEIERVRMTFHDPLAGMGLNLSWKSRAVEIPPGPLNGVGQVEWRKPHGLAYGPSARVATFSGPLVDGRFEGEGRYWHRSGTVYDGQWLNSLMDGDGYLHLADGRSYEGAFEAGHFHGTGRLSAADGSLFEGSFRRGARHGPGVQTNPDGQQFASHWDMGQEDLTQRRMLTRPEGMTPDLVQQTQQSDITFGVTIDRRVSGGVVTYAARNEGARLLAFPDDDGFVQAWRGGGTIRRVDYLDSIGRFAPANFLMTVENRGTSPVRVVGGYLAVASSSPDLEPYLEFATPFDCGEPALTRVDLLNFGWSDPIGAQISGGFVSLDGSRYVLPLNVPPFEGWPTPSFDLKTALTAADPRIASLMTNGLACPAGAYDLCMQTAKAQGLFGPLGDSVYQQGNRIMADYYGIVAYNWRDNAGQTNYKESALRVPIKVGRFVQPNECGEGDGYGTPFPNPFKLPVNQSNYRFPFTLLADIQSGTTANWNFQIDADTASQHDFSIVLQLSDGREVVSRPITLTYFKPKDPWR